VATLADRLGLEALVTRFVRLRRESPGAANAGRKVMALIYAMLPGADSIDDTGLLRAGRTMRPLGGWLSAPSTVGTFLRAFTFGHVRQLDKVLGEALTRALQSGAGPGEERLVVDVDSFVGEVQGHRKQGAAFGCTRQRGYHPLLATRAETGEVVHLRLRKGSANSSRGVVRFAHELIARDGRAGAGGEKLLRADSAFWNRKLIERLQEAGWSYSISVRMQFWVPEVIRCDPRVGLAAAGELLRRRRGADRRDTGWRAAMIMRRTRLLGDQAEPWPNWRHIPFFTNRSEPLEVVKTEHRAHAVVEPRSAT
jgi:Transposase DDE domain group 1